MLNLPQFHIGGFIGVAALGLRLGLQLYNYTKFDPNNFLQYIQDRKVSITQDKHSLMSVSATEGKV